MEVQNNLKEARKLATSLESCIKKVENQLTLMVHPVYSSELKKGVFEELNSLTRRYSKQLGGIIMAYENVQLISSHGWLFDTNPFNHIIIQAQFYVFSPEVGSVLEGVVKKKTVNHIGCLVHGMFNVSVPRPMDTPIDGWCGTYAEEGDAVKLTITQVSMKNFLPYILAELDPERIQELVNARTWEDEGDFDTIDGAQKNNSRVIFDDDSGISISELEESLINSKKETEKQEASLDSDSEACKGENNTNEKESKQKVRGKKRKIQDEYFDGHEGESDMPVTKKKKRDKNNVEENIDWNADEFKDSPKSTKKRKKKHCEDHSRHENIGLEQNTDDGLQMSKEDEVQMPSVLSSSGGSLKKSRIRNKEILQRNSEEESINDWNAEEKFKDSSRKTTKKKKKKQVVEQGSNEMGPEQNIDDRLWTPKEREYLEENEDQTPRVLRTSEHMVKKSRNGKKKVSPRNDEEKDYLNSPRVKEAHKTNSIKNGSPLLTQSSDVNLAFCEQLSVSLPSSCEKLKKGSTTSQRKKKTSSISQELEMSSIITPKRNTKSPSSR